MGVRLRRHRLGAPRGGRLGATAAWLLAGVWAVWALLRLFGLERGFPLVPLLAYTPYLAATAVIPVIVAGALRRWVAVAVGALAAVVLAAAVLPRAFGEDRIESGGTRLRVMSANLMLGRADAEAVVALVGERRIDLLSVQELTPSAVAALRDAGLEHELAHAVLKPAPGSTGSAIYSRRPLTDLSSPNPATGGFFMPTARLVAPGGAAVEVTSVHVRPPTGPDAVSDWTQGMEELPAAGGADLRLLLGDFNATLDHAELRELVDRGYADAGDATGSGLTPTWPSDSILAPVTIDHLLVDERIEVGDYSVDDLPGSDHRAVSAELGLPGG